MAYELNVDARFSAAHALVIRGEREPMHGHDWRVTVTVAGETLDDDGLLCDFHTIEEALEGIVKPFHNRTLNDTAPFDRINPSAELVAKHIAETLSAMMPPEVRVVAVRVTEAPKCSAVWRG